MTVDLREAKKGDRLLTKHGTILTYVEPLPKNNNYDHLVEYPHGALGTRIHDGHTFCNPDKRLEGDEDVVEILK